MNIDFKALAKTAIVVGALAASIGANAFERSSDIHQNTKAVLAACQVPNNSVFSVQFATMNRGVADVLVKATGSQANMVDTYVKSGACDIINAFQAKTNATTTFDQETALALDAIDATMDPLVETAQANYSKEMMNLFGAGVEAPVNLSVPTSGTPNVASEQPSFGM